MRRPLGVKMIAGLAAFRGVIGLWAAIAVVGVLSSFGADDFSVLDLAWLIIAAVFLAFAIGVWRLKGWAWTLGVALTAGSMLLEVFGLLTEGQALAGTLISMAISAVILFLLFKPDVRAAFGRT
jgi:hypothetical protein